MLVCGENSNPFIDDSRTSYFREKSKYSLLTICRLLSCLLLYSLLEIENSWILIKKYKNFYRTKRTQMRKFLRGSFRVREVRRANLEEMRERILMK